MEGLAAIRPTTLMVCSECDGERCELCDFSGTEEVEDITDKLQ